MIPFLKLETTLRGWRPRRPSPSLRTRLLNPPSIGTIEPPLVSRLQNWLAPCTATALLLLTLATAWSPMDPPTRQRISVAALPTLWIPRAASNERNSPPKFHSTNAGAVGPSFGSLLLRQTNVFAR